MCKLVLSNHSSHILWVFSIGLYKIPSKSSPSSALLVSVRAHGKHHVIVVCKDDQACVFRSKGLQIWKTI